jgi:hypothetical protein
MRTKPERLHESKVHIKRQVKIAKSHGFPTDNPHRFAKHHATDCGTPQCVMCGNPRKIWGEETIQEKRFKQAEFDFD